VFPLSANQLFGVAIVKRVLSTGDTISWLMDDNSIGNYGCPFTQQKGRRQKQQATHQEMR